MKAAILAILLASTASAQVVDLERDVFIDHEGNVGPNIFDIGPSQVELDREMGNDAWQFLSAAQKLVLERYAKTCYRDFEEEIWTNWFSKQITRTDDRFLGRDPLLWFNLNRQFGGSQYRPVDEDAEPISAQELLGAMINNDLKMVRFVRDLRQTRGPVYRRKLVTTDGTKHYDPNYSIPEKQGSDESGGFWIYKNKKVSGPEYEPIWTFREQRFPVEIIKRKVCRWQGNEDNERNDEQSARYPETDERNEKSGCCGTSKEDCDCCTCGSDQGRRSTVHCSSVSGCGSD